MTHSLQKGTLVLEDGHRLTGRYFGAFKSAIGEVVFNTGMVGYTEALTDPSYRGQILVLTYPLIGNYGVPDRDRCAAEFESKRIQVAGLIVSEHCRQPAHWNALTSLAEWLEHDGVPALAAVDTRSLAKRLRECGTMLGSMGTESANEHVPLTSSDDLISDVTVPHPITYWRGEKQVILVDCGCKESIVRNLLDRNLTVRRVPYDYDFSHENFDGVLISNGPGDPKTCAKTIAAVQSVMARNIPVFGICLGSQILALAAGGDTFKLKYGHRGQNQPCLAVETRRCYITSQNHGYAVNASTLGSDWDEWFVNANDGTNEGIRHRHKPLYGVQFHPEAAPGPVDANFIFNDFVRDVWQS
ncbi:MAG: carbamoyl-phosphate synthase (glutamine-hydrolyzing) small subunit [Acidobacteria bacterium]|nr:MAG: carbamoyl-phosphate synthase (glutamine-hydrolyzing) small subunit [Acidobacteriota bacterium]